LTTLTTTLPDYEAPPPGRSLWSDAYRRLRHDPVAVVCFGVICVYAIIAIVSPIIVPNWQAEHDYDNTNLSPSLSHPLGTDAMGRSVVKKVFLGAHVSMTAAFFSNIIAIPFGMFMGALAGYYGRRTDDIVVWMYSTLACIPGLVLLIAIKFAFMDTILFKGQFYEMDLGGGISGICIALAVTMWIGTCRLVRAETMKLRETDYVLAARASGRGGLAILLKHVIPNVLHIGIINFSLGFVGAISAEVTLSFLNLGVQNQPSWGKMISEARMDLVVGRWWELAAAVSAAFIIVLAWNLFGDRLRDALDPRLKNV